MGSGDSVWVYSSSVVATDVSGTGNRIGDLIGWGPSARIRSSSVVVGGVSRDW